MPLSVSRSSVTIASVLLVNQRNLVASCARCSLHSPLYDSERRWIATEWLPRSVSPAESVGRQTRFSRSPARTDGVFANHSFLSCCPGTSIDHLTTYHLPLLSIKPFCPVRRDMLLPVRFTGVAGTTLIRVLAESKSSPDPGCAICGIVLFPLAAIMSVNPCVHLCPKSRERAN